MCAVGTGVQTCALPIWCSASCWSSAFVWERWTWCDDADSFANGLYETEAPLGASKGMRDPLASPVVIDPPERKDLQSRGMPIECLKHRRSHRDNWKVGDCTRPEEHTTELQSLMRISYDVFSLKNKNNKNKSNIQS